MFRLFRQSKKLMTVVFGSLFLTGCSFTFVYNNLDWWVDWYLDDYVSLNKSQQKAFDERFTQLHDWHRATQLSAYANQLKSLQAQINQGITPEQIQ